MVDESTSASASDTSAAEADQREPKPHPDIVVRVAPAAFDVVPCACPRCKDDPVDISAPITGPLREVD